MKANCHRPVVARAGRTGVASPASARAVAAEPTGRILAHPDRAAREAKVTSIRVVREWPTGVARAPIG